MQGMTLKNLKVLLITGGWSPEREVALEGARLIARTLSEQGALVEFFDLLDGFDSLAEKAGNADVAFLNLHGAPGEDGLVQAILDRVGCPYQGSGPAGSFLALHKAAAKQLFRHADLNTADWIFLPTPPSAPWAPNLPFPLFVKSNTGGSSLRVYKVHNQTELETALAALFAAGQEALIEPFIKGREVTVGVLENQALPPILITPKAEFFDYTSKYTASGAQELCPAPLPEEITRKAMDMALTAHKILGLEGYSRADFILTEENTLFLLEVNTLPGMVATSLLPQEAAAIGFSFAQLLEKLLEMALTRKK